MHVLMSSLDGVLLPLSLFYDRRNILLFSIIYSYFYFQFLKFFWKSVSNTLQKVPEKNPRYRQFST